jgi:hypothetical protein
MAKAVIANVTKELVRKVYTSDSFNSKIFYKKPYNASIKQEIPFRVKFINIGIEGYGPGSAAPIGIAVIGVNNYIL